MTGDEYRNGEEEQECNLFEHTTISVLAISIAMSVLNGKGNVPVVFCCEG